MSFDRTRSAGYLTNHAARLFALALHERIRPLGLAPAQFMTLLELWEQDGRTQSELVARLDVEQATMANTLARMERDKLIERRPHPKDRRAYLIYLTERARELREPATRAAAQVNDRAFEGIEESDILAFLKVIGRVILNLDRDKRAE
ncbi:MAG: MarR family transcriptional regulator [Neomegalonema sp.]|nr:MarR family transcriptional regulator [Neomegalonema sp.]